MRPVFSRLYLVALALVINGCSASSAKPAGPPPLVAPETRVGPRQQPKREEPPLIAPPPAYGNKIVMASAGGPPETN